MSKMTAKGQVTIPKRLRDYLGLKPGSDVRFELSVTGEVVLKSSETRRKGPFDALLGTAKLDMTTDEIMRLLRGEDE